MGCCCSKEKRIIIVRGDDTNFNDGNLVEFNITSDIYDIADFTAKLVLGDIIKTYDDLSSGVIDFNLSNEETATLPYGDIDGVLYFIDNQNRIATISSVLPFTVVGTVNNNAIATSDVDYTINVEQGGENIFNIDVQSAVSVSVGETETLPAGSAAYVENVGTNNHLVLNFGIPTGESCESATITVGTTETLPTGQDAYVENVGTDSAAILNFGIPRGEQGEQGVPGQDGADGEAGADATINGYNAITLAGSDGITLTRDGSDFSVSGLSLQQDIAGINDLIPSEASSTNKLADKNFVNSSIATNTANFIGTFANVASLNAYSGTVTNNDYAFVVNSVITDNGNDWQTFNALNAYDKDLLTNFDYAWVENGTKFDLYRFDVINQIWDLRVSNTEKSAVTLNTAYNRYKATVTNITVWNWEYTLNNSSFTASQWLAINSGANPTNISQIATNTTNIGTLSSLTTTDKTSLVGAVNAVDSDVTALETKTSGLTYDVPNQTVRISNQTNTATKQVTIGIGATDAGSAVTIGAGAYGNPYGISLGRVAGSKGVASSSDYNTISIGNNVNATTLGGGGNAGAASIGIGGYNFSRGTSSVSIGGSTNMSYMTVAAGSNSIAIGYNTITGASNLTDAKDSTYTPTNNNIAIGNTANAYGSSSVAVGDSSASTAAGALALGFRSYASGSYSIGLGDSDSKNRGAQGDYSVSIGHLAKTDPGTDFGIAIGSGAISAADAAIQIGYGTNSDASTLNVSLGGNDDDSNYKLLDYDGTIPAARYNVMVGASSLDDGVKGAVPAPEAGDEGKFLRGDGTWQEVSGSQPVYNSSTKTLEF